MDANAAYSGLRNSYQQQRDTYAGQFGDASQRYLDLLNRPAGSDAEDAAILGRSREATDMAARRSAARIANNPATVATGGQAGAIAGVEQARLAGQAQLNAKVADMNLLERRNRQQQLVSFLASQLARSEGGLERALSGQAGVNSQFLSLGLNRDAQARQDNTSSIQGLMKLMASLGQSASGAAGKGK